VGPLAGYGQPSHLQDPALVPSMALQTPLEPLNLSDLGREAVTELPSRAEVSCLPI
jgi:hypothetical protein